MATASKRLTRKDLRQPDWFQVTSESALEFIQTHKPAVLAAAGALVVIVAVLWGWQLFKASQDSAASQQFAEALALYQSAKYREAVAAFENVQKYRWSRYAVPAHLYVAHAYLATKETDKATSAAQRSLTATRPNTLYRQIALFALASAEEQSKRCQTAVEHYDQASRINAALQAHAALGKARCAEELGDFKTALATYQAYVKENPGSPFALKLAELEAKISSQPAK